jgi:hypothetical protein
MESNDQELHLLVDSPNQVAHYNTLSAKLGASYEIWHLADLGVKTAAKMFVITVQFMFSVD